MTKVQSNKLQGFKRFIQQANFNFYCGPAPSIQYSLGIDLVNLATLHDGLKKTLLFILCTTLILYFGNFVFAYGNAQTLLYFSAFFFLIYAACHAKQIKELLFRREYALLFIGASILATMGAFPLTEPLANKRFFFNIVYFVSLCLTIQILLEQLPKHLLKKIGLFFLLFLIFSCLFNLYYVVRLDSISGYFSNQHFLAQLCLISLPIFIFHFFHKPHTGSYLIGALLIAIVLYLLIITRSRPAWLAIAVTYISALLIFIPGYKRWGIAAGFIAALVILYFALPSLVAEPVDELLLHFTQEERIFIWKDAITMQLSSTNGIQWIIGHGPGSYKDCFESYVTFRNFLHFPHNFILEVLFESGVIGLVVVCALYACFFALIFRTYKHTKTQKLQLIRLYVLASSFLFFAFFTLPFYSKHVILLQSFFIAYMLNTHYESSRKISR